MSEDYLNIKNYTFEKDIGEGNFGKVKLAIFKKTNEEFAIKILSKEQKTNEIFKISKKKWFQNLINRWNHKFILWINI